MHTMILKNKQREFRMKKITKQTYLDWYKDMLFWRKFEDKLESVYIQQKVRGFLHLYN
jgi:pyruvate dehydrogenase E1 component alpha subunit